MYHLRPIESVIIDATAAGGEFGVVIGAVVDEIERELTEFAEPRHHATTVVGTLHYLTPCADTFR